MKIDPKKHVKPINFFLLVNKKDLPLIALNVVFYGLGTFFTVKMVFYVGQVIDAIQNNSVSARHFIILLLLSLVLQEIFFRIGHIFEVLTEANIRSRVKTALFKYTSKLSFGYFANRFAGQISHQISTAADAFETMTVIVVEKFIDNSWLFMMSVIAIFGIYQPISWFMLIWFVFYLGGVLLLSKKITFYAEEFAHNESETTGTLVDMYTNISTIKVYGKNFDSDRVNFRIQKERKSQITLGRWDICAYAFQGMSTVILGIIIFFLTARGYNLGLISIGSIVAISGVTIKIMEYAYATGHLISNFVRKKGECAQALSDIIITPDILDGKDVSNAWKVIDVNYEHINFFYNHNKKIFNNFSLYIPAKQKVGIVGLSGAGKTTLINLLLRFFEPQSGSVKINGINIATITQSSLMDNISFISQDTSLLHTSILENIKYGSSGIDDKEAIKAAKISYADEFIRKLPDGYNTIVGERGVKLSGGQRQRIAISRAVLKNAPLFLLDEATSALDSDSELKIQKALKILMRDKTVITVAHRLSTLQSMDRIIYIENGRIIEDGTHEELLRNNQKYARLWNMQVGGFLPDRPHMPSLINAKNGNGLI
jgi:ATP-binding cassette, subfamily B, bacterial